MGIAIGVIVAVIGVILLTGAVKLPASITDHISAQPLGWILLVAGVALALLALIASRRSRTTVVERDRELR